MSELQKKNAKLIELNKITTNIQHHKKNINKFVDEELEIYDIVEIYRDKMLELEELFKDYNLSLYESKLGDAVLSYMDYWIYHTINTLLSAGEQIIRYAKLNLFYNISRALVIKYVNEYQKACIYLTHLSIGEDIVDILKIYFEEICGFTSGEYALTYNEIIDALIKLGFNNLIEILDYEVEPIIQKQELRFLNKLK